MSDDRNVDDEVIKELQQMTYAIGHEINQAHEELRMIEGGDQEDWNRVYGKIEGMRVTRNLLEKQWTRLFTQLRERAE